MKINLFKESKLKNAIIKNDINHVKRLLDSGSSPNILIDENTAINYSLEKGHFDIASSLIEKGANLLETDADGYSPLHYAFINEKTPFYIIKELVNNGAKINARSSIGRTPLQLACINGNLTAMKYLIENGANKLTTDMFGNTLMHIAATNNYKDIIYYLTQNELTLFAKNSKGVPAFSLLPEKNNIEFPLKTTLNNKPVVYPIINKGLHVSSSTQALVPYKKKSLHKINAPSNLPRIQSVGSNLTSFSVSSKANYNQLIYGACKSRNVEYTRYLIELGADITRTDILGNNIFLNVACKNNDVKMTKLLIDTGLNIYQNNLLMHSPIELLSPSNKNKIVKYISDNNSIETATKNRSNNDAIDLAEQLDIMNINTPKKSKLRKIKSMVNFDNKNKTCVPSVHFLSEHKKPSKGKELT